MVKKNELSDGYAEMHGWDHYHMNSDKESAIVTTFTVAITFTADRYDVEGPWLAIESAIGRLPHVRRIKCVSTRIDEKYTPHAEDEVD